MHDVVFQARGLPQHILHAFWITEDIIVPLFATPSTKSSYALTGAEPCVLALLIHHVVS